MASFRGIEPLYTATRALISADLSLCRDRLGERGGLTTLRRWGALHYNESISHSVGDTVDIPQSTGSERCAIPKQSAPARRVWILISKWQRKMSSVMNTGVIMYLT
ncbi:hypothetical protein AVEN_131328-1, partial [Araneus ventricosus]